MRPAFSSPRQAAAFVLLVVAVLAAPALLARTGWLDRGNVYPAIAWNYGPFPWIQQKIFAETGDADMVFLGSSHLWVAINTPYVQQKLSEELGRQAEVFTLGWPWPGFDAAYVIARDLLDHRRVHTLVIYDEDPGRNAPHTNSSRWFRIGEQSEALAGLPWMSRATLYGVAVLGTPRQLLSLVRPNLVEDPASGRPNCWTTRYRAPDLARERGALKARLGFDYNPDYVPFPARSEATPADAVVYSANTRAAFRFTGPALEPYHLHFARKLARLCQERGTRLVILHPPVLNERGQTVVPERQKWPEVLGVPVDVVGIPPAKLFAGISDADLPRLFYDDVHLNQSGQEMFTPLITPVLVQLHETSNSTETRYR
jgi:hypothetical protein